MNKRFDIEKDLQLSGIIDQIENTLKCPRFKKYSNFIDIDTWENVRQQMPHNKEVADNGFGFCITNFFESGKFKRIIVINTNNCRQALFTDREIAAIIYHELGHLLNNPVLDEVPTIMDLLYNGIEYSEAIAEDVRSRNSIKMEIYADSYANQFGYGTDLISTFHKQNQLFNQKIEYFEERVESINKNGFFKGAISTT
jgi:hypothetical protein